MKLAAPELKSGKRGFTIIEIALCLGIIGFALVAIIAILPRGLDVQRRNREETIVNHDAQMWLDTLRSGSHGDDDLTNYVLCITNFYTNYNADFTINSGTSGYYYYTPSNSGGVPNPPPPFPLTNGARIIGLLSTPKFFPTNDPPYTSNYLVAYVRSMSGPEVDKPPQNSGTVLADAFTYRMVVENYSDTPMDTNDICMNCVSNSVFARGTSVVTTASQWIDRTNLLYKSWLMQSNLHDLRLVFRYPVLPNGQIPDYGISTYRAMANGALIQTNDFDAPGQAQFFINTGVHMQWPGPNQRPAAQ